MLTFVFVNTLYLDVEQRFRFYCDAGSFLYTGRKALLVLNLHPIPFLLEPRIIRKLFETSELLHVRYPLISDPSGNEISQPRIAYDNPAPRGHAVGYIGKLLRPEFIEITQDRLFEQLGMQSRDAIDGMAAHTGQICHADIPLSVFVNQREAGDATVIALVAGPHIIKKTSVDFADYLKESG